MKIAFIFITAGLFLMKREPQQLIAKVYYEFKHIDDTTQRDNPFHEDVVVYLSDASSIQQSVAALQLKRAVDEFVYNPNRQVNSSGSAVFTLPPISRDISTYSYYHDFTQGKSYLFSSLFDTFYVMETEFPSMDWTLLNEEKEIGGYSCQRAKGYLAGRTYFAWFTMDIPLPYGPWKLHGLPGLILEAEDERKEVSWTYSGFESVPVDSDERIISPREAVKTTKEGFERLLEATRKNPDAARKAATAAAKAGGKMGLQIHNMLLTDFTIGRLKKEGFREKDVNNPLERPGTP